jgi:predicted RNase H-like nuclease
MSEMKTTIINALTGEVNSRKLTAKEIEKIEQERQTAELEQQQKENAKNQAIAKLEQLGLTVEDLQALGL